MKEQDHTPYAIPEPWLERVADAYRFADNFPQDDEGCVSIPCAAPTPIHHTAMACLEHHCRALGVRVERPGIPEEGFEIWDLWHLNQSEIEAYAEQVYLRLKAGRYHDRDLSALKNSLLEAFYNVFDHAEAQGNAYSLIQMREGSDLLSFTLCDFGIGIVNSIRRLRPNVDDMEAMALAVKEGFTVGSRKHNKGYGFSNISCSCAEEGAFTIVSNTVARYSRGGKVRIERLPFDFPGTLIQFETRLGQFPPEEIIDCELNIW